MQKLTTIIKTLTVLLMIFNINLIQASEPLVCSNQATKNYKNWSKKYQKNYDGKNSVKTLKQLERY